MPKPGRIKKTSEHTFAISVQTNRLEHLGLKIGSIINVERLPIEQLDLSKPVVIQDNKSKKYHCGFLVPAFEMFAFEDGRGNIERTFLSGNIGESGQILGVFDSKANSFVPLSIKNGNQ